MKIALQRKPFAPGYKQPEGHSTAVITHALPFYKGLMGSYVHRVRYGHIFRRPNHSHIAVHFWCGNAGFLRTAQKARGGGFLYDTPPENSVFCATCEGRAIGAGLCGAREIAGRPVAFQPRF